MSGHTPGPWVWDSTVWDYDPKQDAPWLVTEVSGERVLHGEIQCSSEANARLIAAAPDLLAALQRLMGETTTMQDAMDAANQARAAIAKATGEAT